MKLALLGYGRMNQLVKTIARDAGHEIRLTLQSGDRGIGVSGLTELLQNVDAAIDFSAADAVVTHATACAYAGVPLVEGTTGWHEQLPEVQRIVEREGGALIYGANFSIGVNLFYRIVAQAAELFHRLPGAYDPFIEEAHHSRKRDAPSGTALRLQDTLASRLNRPVPVASTRAGHIPGTHRVGFDSAADQIMLVHTARTGDGFAVGALAAAQWICGRHGMYEFSETLTDILSEGSTGHDRKVEEHRL